MEEKIVKIRKAIWALFPNMYNLNVIKYHQTKEEGSGTFIVNFMHGETKKIEASYNSEKNELKIKEFV